MKKFLAVIMAAMFLCVGIGMVGCGESVVKPDIELRVVCYDYNGIYLGERRAEWVLSKEDPVIDIHLLYDGNQYAFVITGYRELNSDRLWCDSTSTIIDSKSHIRSYFSDNEGVTKDLFRDSSLGSWQMVINDIGLYSAHIIIEEFGEPNYGSSWNSLEVKFNVIVK